MLTALQGMTAATGKKPNELLTKLSGLFQMKSTNWIEVDFSDWVHRDQQQDTFHIIKEAIFQKRVISFCYFSGKGNKEKRTVRPVRLVFKSKSWYLYLSFSNWAEIIEPQSVRQQMKKRLQEMQEKYFAE